MIKVVGIHHQLYTVLSAVFVDREFYLTDIFEMPERLPANRLRSFQDQVSWLTSRNRSCTPVFRPLQKRASEFERLMSFFESHLRFHAECSIAAESVCITKSVYDAASGVQHVHQKYHRSS